MGKTLLGFGTFAGTIAGIVIIKILNLPWYLTIIFIAALLVGFIVLFSKVMGDYYGKKVPPTEGNTSSDKT
jgi:membrane protein implicated in regulation of membrane protease activity